MVHSNHYIFSAMLPKNFFHLKTKNFSTLHITSIIYFRFVIPIRDVPLTINNNHHDIISHFHNFRSTTSIIRKKIIPPLLFIFNPFIQGFFDILLLSLHPLQTFKTPIMISGNKNGIAFIIFKGRYLSIQFCFSIQTIFMIGFGR